VPLGCTCLTIPEAFSLFDLADVASLKEELSLGLPFPLFAEVAEVLPVTYYNSVHFNSLKLELLLHPTPPLERLTASGGGAADLEKQISHICIRRVTIIKQCL
jgi:hypothetical protein